MYTLQSLNLFAINPYLPSINFHDGQVWLSEQVQDDIESFCGHCPESGNPREVLEFIHEQCTLLKKPTFNEHVAQMSLAGFCVLKAIKHAIEVRMFGIERAGDFRDDLLPVQFQCVETNLSSFSLH
ncbi:hypothetical protein [Paucibacter soli]|uniref:hypothetical protein n=1 Tax=Paucibacter soli TaxID=3133433 RepID=UPI0030A344E9